MHRPLFRLLAAAAALVFVVPAHAEPTEAQQKLPTVTLVVGKTKLNAEVADDDAEREAGLMFRESLGTDEGMLFVMDAPGPVGFWMKNTKIPLSIAYISPIGMIMEIHDLKPLDESVVASQFTSIVYCLEVPQGWFTEHGIYPGDEISGLPVPATAE